ncbi:MAG: hypothetical protein WCJ84_05535 [Candidatus Peregrinibacteria bacterium]
MPNYPFPPFVEKIETGWKKIRGEFHQFVDSPAEKPKTFIEENYNSFSLIDLDFITSWIPYFLVFSYFILADQAPFDRLMLLIHSFQ